MNIKHSYIIYLFIMMVAYCILSYLTPICLCDDIVYLFIWPKDNESFVTPIRKIGDVFYSQYIHYQVLNGRSIIHFFVQLFDGIIRKWLCNIISSIMLGTFIYLASNYINSKNKLLTYSLITFMLFILMPGFHNEFLLFVGVFNYLWVAMATLLFITLIHKYKDNSLSYKILPLIIYSFVAGWLHEGITVPISLTLLVYCLYNHKNINRKSILLYCTLLYCLGTAFCIFSPGTLHRIGDGESGNFIQLFTQKLFSGVVCLLHLRITYIMLILSSYSFFKKKNIWLSHFRQYKYFYIAWLFSFIPVFGSNTTETRTVFYTECLAMIICIDLLVAYLYKYRKICTIFLNIFILCVYCIVLRFSIMNYQNHELIIQQLKDPNQTIISVPQIDALNNKFLSSYIREPIKFGPFENAQGFVQDNMHVKCMKILCHKRKLYFLPDDIVAHITKNDLKSNHIVYNKNHEMMIVKLKSKENITHVTFQLKDENITSLPFYKRILAYKGNTYETSKYYYDTLDFKGQHYLLICCPTNNIKRRIQTILYS